MLKGMPEYRSGADGLQVLQYQRWCHLCCFDLTNGITDHGCPRSGGGWAMWIPYALWPTSSLMNYVVRTFVSSIVVKEILRKSKATWTGDPRLFSCRKKRLLYIVEKQGSQAEPRIQFEVTKNHSRAPVQIRHKSWRVHYTDPDKDGCQKIRANLVDMVSGEELHWKAFS